MTMPFFASGHRRSALVGPHRASVTLAAAAALALAPKGLAGPHLRTPAPALDGQLRIVGSRSMAAPVGRWVAIFRREHPSVRVSVALYGTGTAAGAILDGIADVAPLARPLHSTERALFAPAGFVPAGVRLGVARAGRLRTPLVLYVARPHGATPPALATEFVRVARSAEGRAALVTTS